MKRAARPSLIGSSPRFMHAVDTVDRVARSDASVLVLGEGGTGKSTLARHLHESSGRRAAAFVDVDCAALPANLIASELFGHEPGAFTGASTARVGRFEAAGGGTLFLDHVDALPLATQATLLRALESGEICPVGSERPRPVDFRLVASASEDLRARVREGRFREDLFWRLDVVEVELPPLRERREDLAPLSKRFLVSKGTSARLHDDTLAVLGDHSWPGNLRELRNVCESAATAQRDGVVRPDDLPAWLRHSAPSSDESDLPSAAADEGSPAATAGFQARVHEFQRQLLAHTLERHLWDLDRAAAELALTRHQLRYLIRKLQMRRPG